jgi:hypothetical protein
MSEVKVNKISPRSGTEVTLGDSGDTFTIPSGATITNNGTANGFGADGAVNWQTGSIKTSTFTAVSGEGYFVNSGSALTMNLPAGSAGAIVAVSDYARNFATYNLTISANGSEKIGGQEDDAKLNVNGQAATFVYVDSTKGWINVQNAEDTETGALPFIQATGGTITEDGDFKIHTFTGPGTFQIQSTAPGPSGNPNALEYLVVAGGGGGASSCIGGAGGAGGFRFAAPTLAPLTYPAKPLAGPAALTGAVQSYPITVGSGGAGAVNASSSGRSPAGANGVNSVFSTITSAGGGGGGGRSPNCVSPIIGPAVIGQPGGSGGGSDYGSGGGTGNTPPVSPPQGNPGGTSCSPGPGYGASGGGGALAAGAAGSSSSGGVGGAGGGLPTAFGSNGVPCGSFRYYAGGGGGANETTNVPAGGLGGGGSGGYGGGTAPSTQRTGVVGTVNTGGGGGGTCAGGTGPWCGGAGGSGIVVIRYKFQ